LDFLSGDVVGLGISVTTSTVTLLSNDGAGALAGIETAASARAISIALARAGDELGAFSGGRRSIAGGRRLSVVTTLVRIGRCGIGRCRAARRRVAIRSTVALSTWKDGIGALDFLSGDIVGLSVSVAASTVTLLSNDGAGAFAGVETTASTRTVRVGLAGASNELGARGSAGDVVRSDGECEVKGNKGTDERNSDHDDYR